EVFQSEQRLDRCTSGLAAAHLEALKIDELRKFFRAGVGEVCVDNFQSNEACDGADPRQAGVVHRSEMEVRVFEARQFSEEPKPFARALRGGEAEHPELRKIAQVLQ